MLSLYMLFLFYKDLGLEIFFCKCSNCKICECSKFREIINPKPFIRNIVGIMEHI